MRSLALSLLCACGPIPAPLTAVGEREALVAELDAALGERSAWALPQTPEDGDWSAFPQAPANPLSDGLVALGQALFYEPGLSADPDSLAYKVVSCGTCHNPAGGFGSGAAPGRGIGAGGEGVGVERAVRAGLSMDEVDFTRVNDMRLVNLAWRAKAAGWGGAFDPENGVLPPDQRSYEGAEGLELFVEVALSAHGLLPQEGQDVPEESVIYEEAYAPLLAGAFPERAADEPVTRRQVALAISAYIRSIVSAEAPFQLFLLMDRDADPGDVPLSNEALRGAVLFFGEGRCSRCHEGPALSSESYAVVGARAFEASTEIPGYLPEEPEGESGWGTVGQLFGDDAQSGGRYKATGDLADWGRYIIPSVYGAGAEGVTALGHGAANADVRSMVRHLTGGADPAVNTTLDADMVPYLDPILFEDGPILTEDEVDDLTAFVEQGLTDRALREVHTPDPLSLGGYCAINNDRVSRESTPGCEDAREP